MERIDPRGVVEGSRRRARLGGALSALGIGLAASVWAAGGCSLPTSGTLENPTASEPCDTVNDCKDRSDCMGATCSDDKLCVYTPKTGVAPDDGNDCTVDTCNAGKDEHATKDDGVACKEGKGTGTCQAGACSIQCSAADPSSCDDQNPCTVDSCDVGSATCVRTPLDGPEPGKTPVAGDCKQELCVDGVAKTVVDDTDVKPAADCQTEACKDGVASHGNLPEDSACGGDGKLKCDGNGSCVNCTKDSQCSVATLCQTAVCVSQTCGASNVPAGQDPGLQQTANDCRRAQCDGAGQEQSVADDADVPKDDGNPCTDDVCIGGSPQHPNKAVDTPCGQNKVCNGAGACVACTKSAQCDDGNYCNGAEQCVNAACVPGTPPCNDGLVCNGVETCSNNMCQPGMPPSCTSADPCKVPSCQEPGGCTLSNAPNGTVCAPGNDCTSASTCQNGTCVAGTKGTCDDANPCTNDVCGANGCTFAPKPNGTTCGNMVACVVDELTSGQVCNAGACVPKVANCPGPYVCSDATQCESCSDGAKNGNETDVDCGGGGPCSKCANGQRCTQNSDCNSNNCNNGSGKCQ